MAACLLLAVVCVIASSTSNVHAWEGLLPNEEAIFWSAKYDAIVRSNLTSDDAETLGPKTQRVNYVEYDPDGGQIYFQLGSIYVASGNGSNQRLFCPEVAGWAGILAVDNSNTSDGRLFYSEIHENEIHSIGIQGCSPLKVLVKEVSLITGLALDKIERRVYYTAEGYVNAMDYDGNVIFEKRYGPHATTGIALSQTRFLAANVNGEVPAELFEGRSEQAPRRLGFLAGAQLYVGMPSEEMISIIDLPTNFMFNLTNPAFGGLRYITAHRDLIFFTTKQSTTTRPPSPSGRNSIRMSFFVTHAMGTDSTELGVGHKDVSNIVIREKPAVESQSTSMATSTVAPGPSDLTASQTWKPSIGCLKEDDGTSISIKRQQGLELFSLLVMEPPEDCSADLGEFRQDITVPEDCVVSNTVKVALQLTEIKQVLGGRYFRLFSFTCSDLGSDGKVQELSTDASPKETNAIASSSNYADGSFSLMVVTANSLLEEGQPSSATQLKWSQNGVFLVIRHRLTEGSQHRTLLPLECDTSSTSHPDKMTVWLNKLGSECEKKAGIIGDWTMWTKRSQYDDVTFVPMFPYNFQLRESVTITCSVLECPYVNDPEEFEGKCGENYAKFARCGGTFMGGNSRTRREVSSLAGGRGSPARKEAVPMQDGGTRVMSATFTLV